MKKFLDDLKKEALEQKWNYLDQLVKLNNYITIRNKGVPSDWDTLL